MRIKITLTIFLSFLAIWSFGQLVNNGATITIKNGATLNVQNDVNNNAGTIVMESGSTLKVSGDLTNSATVTADPNSLLEFTGSSGSDWQSGGSDFGMVTLNKTSANVTLADPAVIVGNLSFNADNNRIVLSGNDLTLKGTISSAGSTRYIETDGTASVIRFVGSAGSYDFPIGHVDAYSPLNVDFTGTTSSASTLTATLMATAHPSRYTDADAYTEVYWPLTQSGITDYAATLTGTYADTDFVGTESLIKGASYTTDWNFAGTAGNAGNNTVTGNVTDASVDFTGMNFYGRLDITALFEGPYNGTGMNTTLNSGGNLPLTSPYDATVSVGTIPNSNIVDWVNIEARDAGDAANVLQSYSLFILNDGSVKGLDGSSIPNFKDAPLSGYLAIRHRNHLDVRTPSAINWNNNFSYDFTSALSQAYGTNPMTDLGGGVFGLWTGDLDATGVIDAGDRSEAWNDRNLTGYKDADCTMNGVVDAADRSAVWNNRNISTTID